MPETNGDPNTKRNGAGGSQPTYVAIVIAFLGVVSSLGTAFITAQSRAETTTKKELANFQLDAKSGALVGEIRAFAFGGEYRDSDITVLRARGWLECDGRAISRTEYPRLYRLLQSNENPWGEAAGQPRIPDLRGMFLRGWFHGSVPDDLKDEVATRPASNVGGAKGNRVGSHQVNQIRGDTLLGPFLGRGGSDARMWQSNQHSDKGHGWFFEKYENKRETAPRNVLVMYCVYAGTSDEET